MRRLATWACSSYSGHVGDWSTTRILAVLAAAFAAVAVALVASVWLLNPYPDGTSCYTEQGYASIKAHADDNVSLATGALLCTAVSGIICVVGVARAAGYQLAFALGLLPLFAMGLLAVAHLFISGFYCQN
jgi:hypothetical protein